MAVVERIFVTNRAENVLGRSIERIGEFRMKLFGKRDDVLNSVLLERCRKFLLGWHCELLDHP